MNRLLLAAVLLAGTALTTPASAEVVRLDQLSGTGDNVVFESVSGTLARATFNGQHTGYAEFNCLGGCTGFTGASNGNDIKIQNTNNLGVHVFNDDGTPLGTTTDVFSLKGTGSVTARFTAVDAFGNVEAPQTFDLGALSLSAQSGFTFSTINGEVITGFFLLDPTGNITEFEHYRIDTALIPTPIPAPAALFLSGIVGIGMLARRRKNKALATA